MVSDRSNDIQNVRLKKRFITNVIKPTPKIVDVTTGNFFREKYATVIATRNTNEASSR